MMRVRSAVASQQLDRFVGDDLVAAGDALAADREAVDNGFTARLSGPAGSDVERHQGLAGVLPDALDDLAKRLEINPVNRGVLHFVQHVIFLV
jgi:hypothetical protein